MANVKTYDRCPRCNGDWETPHPISHRSCNCGLDMVGAPGSAWIRYVWQDGSAIDWIDGRICQYWRADGDRMISLPYLRYTITREQVEKLLVLA